MAGRLGAAVALAVLMLGCSTASNQTNSDADSGCVTSASDAAPREAAAAQSDGAPSTGTDTLAGLPPAGQITITTVFKAPFPTEGLTADSSGNLYAPGRAGSTSCPVWRVPVAGGQAAVVGNIAPPCNPNGLTFNSSGDLFIADGDKIYKLTPNVQTPPTAMMFAAGVPGANGIAFDRRGNLWVTDGLTGQGRVWTVASDGTVSEAFRVQPMVNEVNVAAVDGGTEAGVGGIGRDPRALPPGSLTITATTRTAADTAGSIALVANDLAFGADGALFISDTARGAIWKVVFDSQGHPQSPVGCDSTFAPNTLCLDDVFVAHPLLDGLDGIELDDAGNIWGVANERNAVVVVTPQGKVREVFRNAPDPTSRLRNGGPLEFPTSPIFVGSKLCVSQTDVSRRDNAPNSGGEVGPQTTDGGPALLGKVSCLDQTLPHPGLAFP